MKPPTRLIIVCIAALLAFPAVAGATWPAGDSPFLTVRHENGAASQVTPPPAPTASVSRITVSRETSSTLPIVLAAVALGIALTGTAYASVRLRSLSRT
jgi:hypothetical protein